jgi:hypothetical protein
MNELVYALTLFLLNPAQGPVEGVEPTSHYELAAYESETRCDIEARTLRVKISSARLKCMPRFLSPDEKRALAVLKG